MFCTDCGQELPADAVFCSRCGKRQRAGGYAPGVQREICEVRRSREEGEWFAAGDVFWEAVAVGPRGRYPVARSRSCPREEAGSAAEVKRTDALLDTLVDDLVREGWLPLGLGPEWYSYRFERRLHPVPAEAQSDSTRRDAAAAGDPVDIEPAPTDAAGKNLPAGPEKASASKSLPRRTSR